MNNKVVSLCAIAALTFTSSSILAANNTLTALGIDQPINIDGTPEGLWDRAEPLTIKLDELPYKPSNGYEGMKEVELQARALYDDEHLYLLMTWEDPTQSLERFPWVKQNDGSWKQLMNKDSTGHDNTYYEDKLALFWNINVKRFQKKGCDKSCHMPEDDGLLEGVEPGSAGRHYTNNADETIDMWHWKSARSNPVNQIDDQYMNADRKESKSWGRHSDDKTGGSYVNNKNSDGSAPAWMNATANGPRYWVLDSDKVPFVDNFKPGDVIGGIVASPATGPRGDISAKGVWKDGVWTLEIKRKLVTGHQTAERQDIQFNDLGKSYYFGAAVFDNSQINHIHHTKSYRLVFSQ